MSTAMPFEPSTWRSVARSVGASVVVHLLAIAGFLGYALQHPARVFSPRGNPSGTRIDLVYLPGRPPASTLHPAAKLRATRVARLTPSLAPALPSLPSPPLPHVTLSPAAPPGVNSSSLADASDQAKGSNSWGPGDIQIALTTYSPSPAPDLSALPRGVQGDVVVDVTISPDGKVDDLTVLKTLGYGLESSVVNTVRTWTFRPATKDGVPVASEQELIFHFRRPEFN